MRGDSPMVLFRGWGATLPGCRRTPAPRALAQCGGQCQRCRQHRPEVLAPLCQMALTIQAAKGRAHAIVDSFSELLGRTAGSHWA